MVCLFRKGCKTRVIQWAGKAPTETDKIVGYFILISHFIAFFFFVFHYLFPEQIHEEGWKT